MIYDAEDDYGIEIHTFDYDKILELIKNFFDKKNLKFVVEEKLNGDESVNFVGHEKFTRTKIYDDYPTGHLIVETEDRNFIDYIKGLSEEDVL